MIQLGLLLSRRAWRWLMRPERNDAIVTYMTNCLHCSFCNQTEQQTGPLLAKMDISFKRHLIRICKSCAQTAIKVIDGEVLRRAGERPRLQAT